MKRGIGVLWKENFYGVVTALGGGRAGGPRGQVYVTFFTQGRPSGGHWIEVSELSPCPKPPEPELKFPMSAGTRTS